MTRILAADIGGTKTLLQLSDVGDETQIVSEKRYRSQDFARFSDLLDDFLSEQVARQNRAIDRVCFAVAGPLAEDGQTAKVTNLPWHLDSRTLAEQLSCASVRLINDFEAVGYGVGTLGNNDLETVQAGLPVTDGLQLVIGAGTGLGVAQRITAPSLQVIASEAGHSDFAPADTLQRALLDYLGRQMTHVSWECVLSGSGLVNIYHFLRDTGHHEESPLVRQAMAGQDAAAVISRFALEHRDPLAIAAVELFASVYGAAAGDLALFCLPYGGVYIAGGIAPKIASVLQSGLFVRAFNRKNKMAHLLNTIPVYLVRDAQIGLHGARFVAAQR